MRLHPKIRKEQILTAALKLAEKKGVHGFTRADIAAQINISDALVNSYFGTMAQLHRDVMRAAVKQQVLSVIAQGVISKNPHALKAPPLLKKRALNSVL